MTVTVEDEFEVSFDVDESVELPDWSLDIVATSTPRAPVHLVAVYFDTAEGALAAARIALRHRSGGTDAGWHIKRKANDRRREQHWEAEPWADEVPDDIRAELVGIIGDQPLAPIARIVNDRTVIDLFGADGGQLAEFCDDHVHGTRLADGREVAWREWEIELSNAGELSDKARNERLERLSRHVAAPGVHAASAESKLARVLGG